MYLGFQDLSARWVYTRRGAYKVVARQDFPAPALVIDLGRTKAWALADIEVYEKAHPELKSEAAKRRKVSGYARAKLKGIKPKA